MKTPKHPRYILPLLIAIAALFAFAFTACGGGGDDVGATPTAAESRTPAGGTPGAVTTGTPSSGDPQATPGANGSGNGQNGEADPPALREYFDELEEIDQAIDEQLEEALDDLEDAEDLAAIEAAYTRIELIYYEYLTSVQELDFPDEVADAYFELVDATHAMYDLIVQALDAAIDGSSPADVDAVVETAAFRNAITRMQDACAAFDQIAQDNGMPLDLNCPTL